MVAHLLHKPIRQQARNRSARNVNPSLGLLRHCLFIRRGVVVTEETVENAGTLLSKITVATPLNLRSLDGFMLGQFSDVVTKRIVFHIQQFSQLLNLWLAVRSPKLA